MGRRPAARPGPRGGVPWEL